jgi:hypothetical protein
MKHIISNIKENEEIELTLYQCLRLVKIIASERARDYGFKERYISKFITDVRDIELCQQCDEIAELTSANYCTLQKGGGGEESAFTRLTKRFMCRKSSSKIVPQTKVQNVTPPPPQQPKHILTN